MRLSLRTLLAFEDKVFDIEQQRQLEKHIRQDDVSVLTLRRIRGVIRQPNLGVPGRYQQREELDPNVVAEYIDEEMPAEVQERFERFCLSSDKFLAEVASVHQVLSNVLGEPARTSRECRLRCYQANRKRPVLTEEPEFRFFDPIKPEPIKQESCEPVSQKPAVPKPDVIFARVYEEIPDVIVPVKPKPAEPEPLPRKPEEGGPRKSPLNFWGGIALLLFPAGFVLGLLILPHLSGQKTEEAPRRVILERPPMPAAVPPVREQEPVIAPVSLTKIPEPAQTGPEIVPVPMRVKPEELNDPFLTAAVENNNEGGSAEEFAPVEIPQSGPEKPALAKTAAVQTVSEQTPRAEKIPPPLAEPEPFDAKSFIAFQPVSSLPSRSKAADTAERRLEVQPPKAVAAVPVPAGAVEWGTKPNRVIAPEAAPQEPKTFVLAAERVPVSQEQSAARETSIGRVVLSAEPGIVFSASSSGSQWELKPPPFNLSPEQYLLTFAPFRAELECGSGLILEMNGDSKLCVLPPDENGVPGIYVDYGRIVIRHQPAENGTVPKLPVSLRIQTEKIEGVLELNGQKSAAFIDTFAEVIEPDNTENTVGKRNRPVPVLGFIPEPGKTVFWRMTGQETPVAADRNSSIQLIPNASGLGSIQNIPDWQHRTGLPKEAAVFADVCFRTFKQHPGSIEAALEVLSKNTSPLIRSFAFRLWGDLGRFDIPLSVLSEKANSDEMVCQVLASYFKEVIKRDSESVQRLSDAMETIKRK
ncbi:MAG: hypothetical protein LBN39_02380 [Planctomycetaceae bacterium]|jgi:hypothetical protein|nr:hypothetical protein [Planctomycetaceae bacterium]